MRPVSNGDLLRYAYQKNFEWLQVKGTGKCGFYRIFGAEPREDIKEKEEKEKEKEKQKKEEKVCDANNSINCILLMFFLG